MKSRIKYLDQLRFFAICNIILLHVITIFRWKYYGESSSNYFIWTFINSFTRVGIPIFFMLTGILMFEKKDENYLYYLKKRVFKLVTSYFLFCILYFIYNGITKNTPITIYEFVKTSTSGAVAYHLWFMPVIIIIYTFIPFLKKLVINLKEIELRNLICAIFIIGNCFIGVASFLDVYGYHILRNFAVPNLIVYTNYCLLGYYLYKYDRKINKRVIIFSILSFLAMPVATYMVSRYEINDVFLDAISPFVLFPATLVFILFKRSKIVLSKRMESFLAKSSQVIMYVYFIHVLILSIFQKILSTQIKNSGLLGDTFLILGLFVIVSVLSFTYAFCWTKIKKLFMKYYENIMKILTIIFTYIMILFFAFIIGLTLVNHYNYIKMNYLGTIIGIVVWIILCYFIYKHQDKLFKNKIVNCILILLYISIQVIVIHFFMVKPTWDFGSVYTIAKDYALGVTNGFTADYLYVCDNNIAISFMFNIIFKVGAIIGLKKHLLELGIAVNCFMIDISFIYLYKFMNKINKKYSKPFFIFCLFFSPLIFYLPIFYTDTITLPFIIIPLYYVYNYINEKQDIRYLFASGLLFGFGTLLKPTVIIPFIAVILSLVVYRNKKIDYYQVIPIMLSCIVLPMVGYKFYVNHFFERNFFEEARIPKNHYIMIGLENNGGFSQEALDYTQSYAGETNRKKADNKRIKNRIKEMIKKHEVIPFYTKKISYTWTDGTLYAREKLRREPSHKSLVKYVKSEGNDDYLYWAISNAEWLIILGLMLFGIIYKKYLPKEVQVLQFILNMSIFGIFLFLLIWETRSRYLVNYSSIFLLNAFIGLNAIIYYRKTKKGRRA